jgi:hypothetical protein
MAEDNEDKEFFGIKPQQSAYELAHFDQRDQEVLTRLSILSQQCNLLRSRQSSLAKENATLKSELVPLKLFHQKLTSIWAVLVAVSAGIVGILQFIKLVAGFLGK